MADDQSDTEREIRRLYREFAQEPLPDPPVSDEELVAMLRARLQEGASPTDDGYRGRRPRQSIALRLALAAQWPTWARCASSSSTRETDTMIIRTGALAVLGALLGVALTACSIGGASGAQPQPPIQPTSTMSASSVKPPATAPNLKTLVQMGATTGSAVVGSFYGQAGQVWIDFSCLGTGTATINYRPIGSVDIPCSSAAVNATRNQIHFPAGHQISLQVKAPATVQWTVLVQE